MQTTDLDGTGVLDEAYERLHRTGPEFDGYLSNHGPMASEALVQLGLGEHVHRWLHGYTGRLEERPTGSDRITPAELANALGDPRRLGDWLDYFEIQVADHNSPRAGRRVATSAARLAGQRHPQPHPDGTRGPRLERRADSTKGCRARPGPGVLGGPLPAPGRRRSPDRSTHGYPGTRRGSSSA